MIHGICFDLGGTFIKSEGAASELGMCQRIARVVDKPLDEILPAIDFHLRTRTGSMDTLARNFCSAVGYDDPSRLVREALTTNSHAVLYDDVLETLPQLRRYKLGIISNCACWNVAPLSDLGIKETFDTVVYSFTAGYTKPDVRIFQTAAERIEIAAHQLLYVGDTANDIRGARNAGWKSIHLRRSGSPESDIEADHVITDLRQLPVLAEKMRG